MSAAFGESAPLHSLHNMSGPPRSTAEIRPLRVGWKRTSILRGWGGCPASIPFGPSGTFFARVHLVGLLVDGRSHVARGSGLMRGAGRETPDLVDALGMLRTGRKTGKALAADRIECERRPFAELHAEFLDRVAALGDLDLPPLLLARTLDCSNAALRAVEPAVAIRLLAGTAGGIFVHARAPSAEHFLSGLPGAAVPWEAAFDYYLPSSHA